MKTKLLFVLTLLLTSFGYAQVQPIVQNAVFDNIPKSSGSDCSCSGWINKSLGDQGESSTINDNDVVKYDNIESDAIYQEVAVIANNDYTLDLDYRFSTDPTTTQFLEITILKGSSYVNGYVPAYAVPADAAQDGLGYATVAEVDLASNQIIRATVAPPGNTDLNPITTLSFNTGAETSIAIFIRAVGPYDAALHGDPDDDKGWMNGDSEVRMDNLSLVNLGVLSTQEFFASSLKVYPNPAKTILNISHSDNSQIDSVEMFSILGRNVLTSKSLINDAIDVSEIASGVYLLRINSGENSATKRIVME